MVAQAPGFVKGNVKIFPEPAKKRAETAGGLPVGAKKPPGRRRLFSYVFLINRSRHLGQVMEILPFPRGTRTVWRHLGHWK